MNATQKGRECVERYAHGESIDLGGSVFSLGINNLTKDELVDIGHRVASMHFKTQGAREGFVVGWLSIGLQIIDKASVAPQNRVERHRNASKIIPFRARRVQ